MAVDIKYIIGDATEPQGEGNKIIVHCCNNIGGWGAGFVLSLSKKWLEPGSKERVVPPHHRVFISIGGRDCDGFGWREYRSFENLKEAQEDVDNTLEWADGPTDYCTLNVDDWERGQEPEYRDRFAEAMGY